MRFSKHFFHACVPTTLKLGFSSSVITSEQERQRSCDDGHHSGFLKQFCSIFLRKLLKYWFLSLLKESLSWANSIQLLSVWKHKPTIAAEMKSKASISSHNQGYSPKTSSRWPTPFCLNQVTLAIGNSSLRIMLMVFTHSLHREFLGIPCQGRCMWNYCCEKQKWQEKAEVFTPFSFWGQCLASALNGQFSHWTHSF